MVRAGCAFVAGIHPSRTWTSGSFESVRWNACVHRLDLGLYSHPKEFLGNGVWTHVNSKGKIPSTGKCPQRRIEPATLWTASPSTTNWAILAPRCCLDFLDILYKSQLIQCVVFITTVLGTNGPFFGFSYFIMCTSSFPEDVCLLSEVNRCQVFQGLILAYRKHPASCVTATEGMNADNSITHLWTNNLLLYLPPVPYFGLFLSTHFSRNKDVTMLMISVMQKQHKGISILSHQYCSSNLCLDKCLLKDPAVCIISSMDCLKAIPRQSITHQIYEFVLPVGQKGILWILQYHVTTKACFNAQVSMSLQMSAICDCAVAASSVKDNGGFPTLASYKLCVCIDANSL